MKKLFITMFIIILAAASSVNFTAAQNETEMMITNTAEETLNRNSAKVECLESGCFNITFEEGYNGYCINYGKEDAEIGDSFTRENTSHATNKNTGEDVGNCIKVFFVEYYDHAMKNEIVTQHTIWHFTDDFNGWRLDYDLIDDIKATSATMTIPDHGAVRKINNTTEAVFDFTVLKSSEADNQNFFGYKITYRDIINEILKNNETNDTMTDLMENSTSNKNMTQKENSSIQNENTPHEITPKNEIIVKESEKTTSSHENQKKNNEIISLSKHVTGQNRPIGIIMLMILLLIVGIKYIRFYKK